MTDRIEASESEYLSPAEAATATRLHSRTLARMADRGQLEAFYLPSGHRRYLRSDIARLLATRAEQVA